MADPRENTRWTDAEIALVERKWNHDGLSASVIARQLGRTRSAVCGMINRHPGRFNERQTSAMALRADKRRQMAAARPDRENAWTPDLVNQLKTMWRADVTISDMAVKIGRSYEAVNRYVNKHREDFPRRYKTGETVMSRVTVKIFTPPRTTSLGARGAATAPTGEAVAFLDVSDRQCRFPLWGADENPGAAGLCCGAAIDFGMVYCGFHRRVTTSGTMTGGQFAAVAA